MSRFLRLTALLLLGFLAVGQTGAPAFLAGLWARVAMYQEYETIMSRPQAVELVLHGDLGCGFFTEIEELTETADSIMLAWFEGAQPLYLPALSSLKTAEPLSNSAVHQKDIGALPDHWEALEPPPPRAA